jgi:uncharacterized protein (DUF58 family)
MKWAEAHAIAKEAGFHGAIQALTVYVSKAKKTARKSRVAPAAVAVEPTSANHDLAAAIDRLVQNRVREELEKAIEALKSSM